MWCTALVLLEALVGAVIGLRKGHCRLINVP